MLVCKCVTEARCACLIDPHSLLVVAAAVARAAIIWMLRTYFSTPNDLKPRSDCSLSAYQTSTAQYCASEFGAVSRMARNFEVVHTELLPPACSLVSVARIALLTCCHAVGLNTCRVSAAILVELNAHFGQAIGKRCHPFVVALQIVIVFHGRLGLFSAFRSAATSNRLVILV